jgi:hypothetical protein
MLKKYGDQRFIGASIGSATGGVPQNDRAFASLSIATQSAEYTTCAKTSPLKNPLPQVVLSIGYEHFDRIILHRCFDSSPIFFELLLIDGFSSREDNLCGHDRSPSLLIDYRNSHGNPWAVARIFNSVKCQESCRRAQTVGRFRRR